MRVVFMGTPDFSRVSLSALIDGGFEVCGVFTVPDRPRNRGMKLTASPVKDLAAERGIAVYQPESLRDGTARGILEELRPDIAAVVAYGKLLPKELLEVPRYGCVNIHASLLPKYRGAAPIQWAVLNGDRITGVTSMHMSEGLDEGDIIYADQTEIGEFETSSELFERLSVMGAELLCKTVRDIGAGIAPRIPQNHNNATYTVQLTKALSPIDWDKTPREIIKQIYGLRSWPVAETEIGGIKLRVFAAEYTGRCSDMQPGTVAVADKQGIEIACGNGETVRITELQAAGGRRMSAADYLKGHRIEIGTGI